MNPADRLFAVRPDAPGALLAEAELIRAVRAVESAGIDCAVIKGIPLARRLYEHVDARGVPVDADLLVRRADVPEAIDALIGAGYHSAYLPPAPRQITALLDGVWKVVLRRKVEAGVSSTVELHWAPFSPRTYPLDEYLVWQHIEPFELPGRTVLMPDPALTVVLIACHVAQSGLAQPRLMQDLATAWNRWHDEIDTAELLSLVSAARAAAALSYSMAVADHLGLLSTASLRSSSWQAELALRLWPGGRGRSPAQVPALGGDEGDPAQVPAPDYRGQIAALLLCSPSRMVRELAAAALPSRAAIAVATDSPFSGRPVYLLELLRRLGRIARGIADPGRSGAPC